MYTLQPQLLRYAAALLLTTVTTSGIFVIEPALETTTIVLCYLLGVLVIATTAGLGPGIVASLSGFLAFNFFFLSPRYTFHVTDTQDVLHLLSFLTVAIVASSLAARVQRATERERRRVTELAALYDLSQAISAQVDLDQILPAITETTCRLLHVPMCSVLLYNDAGVLTEQARCGHSDPRLQTTNVPIRDSAVVLGILRVVERMPGQGLGHDDQRLLTTLVAQVRLAVDRARLVAQIAHTQALIESDRLKSALLASVSHDLRTPLAVIKGATSTLLADDITWDAATQRSLIQPIDAEVDRLNRIVGNLLNMSQIESGTLSTKRDWQDLAEVLGAVLERMARSFEGRAIAVELPPDLPLVPINATLVDQVLTNLLENALNYTPPGTPITIKAYQHTAGAALASVTMVVRDQGPGIPADDLKRIFDKFYRRGDRRIEGNGAGLGLAICKGIIEAHNGHIWAENCRDGGAAFAFTLPLAVQSTPGARPTPLARQDEQVSAMTAVVVSQRGS